MQQFRQTIEYFSRKLGVTAQCETLCEKHNFEGFYPLSRQYFNQQPRSPDSDRLLLGSFVY